MKSPRCEHDCQALHNEGQDDRNLRPKQLRNREVLPFPKDGSAPNRLLA